LADVVGILVVGTPQAAILLAGPLVAGYYVYGSLEAAIRTYLLAACFIILALYALVLVWNLEIDGRGIRFRRLLGSPKFLAWERIASISEVSRWETVETYAFFPWRVLTWGMTMRHMFRLEWDGGRKFYFPPADVLTFRRAVNRWRPDLMPVVDPEPPGAALLLPPAEETGNPYQAPKSGLIRPPD
jgi:hypothetical protein